MSLLESQHSWLARLMQKLLEGEPDVIALLEPFGEPPRFVRAVRYRYHFATPEERAQSGHWWRREDERIYAPQLSGSRLQTSDLGP
ncbi:MAG TPA: lipase maturation factor family protein [Burkholderiales bacterium]|nr:lipase maturation factor family protein [Burkholderiales bacterium]